MEWILIAILLVIIVLLVLSRKRESHDAFVEYDRSKNIKPDGITSHTSFTTTHDGHLHSHEEKKSDFNQSHFNAMKRNQQRPNQQFTGAFELDADDKVYVAGLIKEMQKVRAIKYIIDKYGVSLRDAKATVDTMSRNVL
ncbi:hypothetical protein [Erysipelothrix aquatica]|uniref:hypothetical protein n=1 Tax=Erysipelothrix aquatica TaxID=2683714 RepID=UPI001359AE0B|nr:hypothetical protein [Erysipelothrix aquatica]